MTLLPVTYPSTYYLATFVKPGTSWKIMRHFVHRPLFFNFTILRKCSNDYRIGSRRRRRAYTLILVSRDQRSSAACPYMFKTLERLWTKGEAVLREAVHRWAFWLEGGQKTSSDVYLCRRLLLLLRSISRHIVDVVTTNDMRKNWKWRFLFHPSFPCTCSDPIFK